MRLSRSVRRFLGISLLLNSAFMFAAQQTEAQRIIKIQDADETPVRKVAQGSIPALRPAVATSTIQAPASDLAIAHPTAKLICIAGCVGKK